MSDPRSGQSNQYPVDDPRDDKLFGNDEKVMPWMPGHPATSAASESPETLEERAEYFGMDRDEEVPYQEDDSVEFNLDAVDDLKRELQADEGDRR